MKKRKLKSSSKWLDKYPEGGQPVLNNDQQFLIDMTNSPLFEERYSKMTGKPMPIPYTNDSKPNDQNLYYPTEQYKKDIVNNINTVRYAPQGEGDFSEGKDGIAAGAYYRGNIPADLEADFRKWLPKKEKNFSKFDASVNYLLNNEHTVFTSKTENRPYTRTHETSHASTEGILNPVYPYKAENRNPYKPYGAAYADYHQPYYDDPNMQKYLSNPSEIKARVDASRKYLMDKGEYDPVNKKFNSRHYTELLNAASKEDNISDLIHNFSKEEVIKMFNEMVTNDPKDIPVAKYGGWLDSYGDGGPKKDRRKIPQSGMVIDKRTNQAYYFGDKGETGTFPVLTGLNPELNSNTYTQKTLHENPQLKNTPVGYYMMDEGLPKTPYTNAIYSGRIRPMQPIPVPAFGVKAADSEDISIHSTANNPNDPSFFNTRNKMYSAPGDKRYVSQGCINCQKESYDAFNKAIPKSDTMMVIDSKNPRDLILLEQAKARMKKPIKQEGGDTKNWLDKYK